MVDGNEDVSTTDDEFPTPLSTDDYRSKQSKWGMGSGDWGMGKKTRIGDRKIKLKEESKMRSGISSLFPTPHSPLPIPHSPLLALSNSPGKCIKYARSH
jgi:hypothetical protein